MKFFMYLIVVVLLVGMWFGMNIARDRPVLSNPFGVDMQQKAVGAARDMIEQSKRALRDQLK